MVNAIIGNERDKTKGSTVEQKWHNIYLTNILLCKMKVRDDQMCAYCNDVVDTVNTSLLTVRRFRRFGITLSNIFYLLLKFRPI